MRNSPALPLIAIVAAFVLAVVVAVVHDPGSPLNELQLGGVAWSVGLAIFGLQGLISVLVEGTELRPGRVRPRLTDLLSSTIVVFSLVLLGIAVTLAVGLRADWRSPTLGILAGAGCLDLAFLLVCYKEAFVGDEATLDERDDGVPW